MAGPRTLSVLLVLLLAACASGPPAPVLDRSSGYRSPGSQARMPEVHLVQRGDTLYSIAFRYNLDHRTLATWNAIGPPYTIYPDQVLWLRPPRQQQSHRTAASKPAVAASNKPTARTSTRPKVSDSAAGSSEADAAGSASRVVAVPPASSENTTTETGGEHLAADLRWVWPVAGGRLNRAFVAGNSDRQGIDIAGLAGQPVVAAADGEVVYSGAGFVGYVGLIIIKHSDSLLSAYAHNRRRLVAEGDRVKAGQQIAELGQSPRGVDEVYVQIRRNGVPQDPMNYLPAR